MGRLSEAIIKELGFETQEFENRLVNQIPVAAAKIVTTNADRLVLIFVNLGVNNAYIHFNNDVSATNGIEVSANGGSVAMNYKEDFSLVGREWYGSAPAGLVNCLILEVIGV